MRQEDFINCTLGCGIYIITNTTNNHVYIGQTTRRFVERWKEHIKCSFSPSNEDYWFPLHAAMRKYGVDCFDFSVLEQCAVTDLDARERYWIRYYDATNHDNYNCLPGGQSYRSDDDEKWLAIINDIINTQDSLVCIAQRHHVSDETVSAMNRGVRHAFPQFTYPLRKKYSISGISEIIKQIINTNKSFQVIATETGTSLSKIKHINKGDGNYHVTGYKYPLRVISTMSEETWQNIITDLQTTDLDFYAIAAKYGLSYDTIRKINNGQRHYHEGIEYPVRK